MNEGVSFLSHLAFCRPRLLWELCETNVIVIGIGLSTTVSTRCCCWECYGRVVWGEKWLRREGERREGRSPASRSSPLATVALIPPAPLQRPASRNSCNEMTLKMSSRSAYYTVVSEAFERFLEAFQMKGKSGFNSPGWGGLMLEV
jgi:hypothetical protein